MDSETLEALHAIAPDHKTDATVDALELSDDELSFVGGGVADAGIVHRF